ncbi:subtilisin-like protein [Lactarius psammicola]|nr:subtilisin-like protein [Lactarius psammicola]
MHYHWFFVLSILFAAPPADLATPPATLWGDNRVMHTWNSVPANWKSLGPPPAGTTIDLYIALQPHREDALIEALCEVSNPRHQRYGAHLSKEQVAELVAPHEYTLELVHSWLKYHGVQPSSISTSHGGGWLTITDVPVSRADELLCASYQLYRYTGANGTDSEVILRTVSYAIPAALHEHVQTVAPTTHFASTHMPVQTPGKRSSEEAAAMINATSGESVRELSRRQDPVVMPPFLRRLYKTETYVPAAIDRNSLGILGLRNEYPNQADLRQFMYNFRVDALPATYSVEFVNGGGYDPRNPTVEASVDIQYAEAIAYPTPHIFYSTGGPLYWPAGTGEPGRGDAYLEWLRYLLPRRNIPATISVSYANPETSLPRAYAISLCNLFAALGLRGASVLVATGDHGVGQGDCTDNSGNVRFIPMFPASCPWVTSVGSTMFQNPEIAMPFSGGGFSYHFERPIYQDHAVFPFLEYLGIEYVGLYNAEGRGIPDISAQGHLFRIILAGAFYLVSGTSCSTPTVAGIVSLLNDFRISTGRPPLGFLNFWLYYHSFPGFNDIMFGSNPGCNTDGFFAIPGWDPVTGLGTPDFERLIELLVTTT